MTDESKVVEKIKAILRKANDDAGATEEERETAMRMANSLLIKHGLEMHDLGTLEDNTTPGREFERDVAFKTDGELDYWKGLLLDRIARAYFTKVYHMDDWNGESTRAKSWYILGRRDYVQATAMMFDYVKPQIERELNLALSSMSQSARYARRYALEVWAQEHGEPAIDIDTEELAEFAAAHFEYLRESLGADGALEDIMGLTGIAKSYAAEVRPYIRKKKIAPSLSSNLGIWRRSFVAGAVNKIGNRLQEMMREEIVEQGEAGTALVKDESEDLRAYMKEIGLKLSRTNSERQYDPNAGAAGDAVGARADLSVGSQLSGTRRQLNG